MEIEFGGDDRNPVFSFFGAELEFKPPGKASEPTLRKGDKSADGWVEYLQELLNLHKDAGLEVDGDFGGETLEGGQGLPAHAEEGEGSEVLEDGVVGDETWSYLREGAPAKPETDGRKPHTFVEKGDEARWVAREGAARLRRRPRHADACSAVSVGDVDQIARRIVRFRIISPSGDGEGRSTRLIGKGDEEQQDRPGQPSTWSRSRTFPKLFGGAGARRPNGDLQGRRRTSRPTSAATPSTAC